jgi:hypothetical protein
MKLNILLYISWHELLLSIYLDRLLVSITDFFC